MAPTTKTIVIPFDKFLPDKGVAKLQPTENYLVDVRNLIPHANGWVSMHGYRPLSELPTFGDDSETVGAAEHTLGKFLYKVHTMDRAGNLAVTDPRENTSYLIWESFGVNPTPVPGAVPDSVGAHFTSFGDAMMVTTGLNNPIYMYIENHSSEPFVPDPYEQMIVEGTFNYPTVPSNYYYTARYCGTMRQRIIIAYLYGGVNGDTANYETHKNRVAWSATNNPAEFHDQNYNENATQSGWAELPDNHGPITGLCAGADYTLVFKARTIYRMTHIGGIYIYDFQPIPQHVGTVWSHSIARVGNDVFFWSGSGPAVYRGETHSVEFLGNSKVSRWLNDVNLLTDDILDTNYRSRFLPDAPVSMLSAGVDQYSGCVVWTFPASGGKKEATTTNYALVYHYITGSFSFLDTSLHSGTERSITYCTGTSDTGDYYRPLRDILFFIGGHDSYSELVAGFKRDRSGNDSYPAIPPSDNYDKYFEDRRVFATYPHTEFMAGNRCKINGVRLRYTRRADAGTVDEHEIWYVLTIYSRENHADDSTKTVITTVDSRGSEDLRGFVRVPNCPYRTMHAMTVELFGQRADEPDDWNNVGAISELEGVTLELQQGGEK